MFLDVLKDDMSFLIDRKKSSLNYLIYNKNHPHKPFQSNQKIMVLVKWHTFNFLGINEENNNKGEGSNYLILKYK